MIVADTNLLVGLYLPSLRDSCERVQMYGDTGGELPPVLDQESEAFLR